MARYFTNLTTNYCHLWGVWEAIRELIQNGIDEKVVNPENDFTFEYDKERETIKITNKCSILDRSSLLLGYSSKRDNEDTIGRHGDGYKSALLVLLRLGKNVKIYNYHKKEIWTPILDKSDKYNGESVLFIDIKKHIFKKVPNHNLTWEISGITENEMSLINEKYLGFHEIKDNEKYYDKETKSTILLNEKYAGKVYVNGLFVQDVKNRFKFGYDIAPKHLTLQRDRIALNVYELKMIAAKILYNYTENSEEGSKVVSSLVESNADDIENLHCYFWGHKRNLSTKIKNDFFNEYGKNAYPVLNEKEASNMRSVFGSEIKPVVLNEVHRKILVSEPEIISVLEKKNAEVGKAISSPSDLMKLFVSYLKTKTVAPYGSYCLSESDFEKFIEMSELFCFSDDANIKPFLNGFSENTEPEIDSASESGIDTDNSNSDCSEKFQADDEFLCQLPKMPFGDLNCDVLEPDDDIPFGR